MHKRSGRSASLAMTISFNLSILMESELSESLRGSVERVYQKDINESFLRINYYVLSWFELCVFADEVFRLVEFMGICFLI